MKQCALCQHNAPQFCPSCLTCGGRYLRAIKSHPKRSQDWLRKALADWMAMNHSEEKLRELAAGSDRRSH